MSVRNMNSYRRENRKHSLAVTFISWKIELSCFIWQVQKKREFTALINSYQESTCYYSFQSDYEEQKNKYVITRNSINCVNAADMKMPLNILTCERI
jgi:cytochrome oxidase assembly protein ShyY1